MRKRSGCRLNCRERALLPWLFLGGMAVAALIGVRGKASAATQQQSATAPSAAPTLAFDVAAIHPHVSEPHEHNSIWSSPFDGRFKAENISVMMLIHWAYEMPDTRILDAPGWASSTCFNIDAAADPSVDAALHQMTSDAGRKQKEKMVQALLANRFHLVLHTETRDLPIYKLVIARGGAKFGDPKSSGTIVNHGRDHVEVEGANSATLLAEELSKETGRGVIDKTGISGRYDLKLHWTPDESTVSALNGSASPASDAGPALFTALEEQLGLKLEPAKGPVLVLVIDHVEMPSAN
ncbi:MAG: TIGR03435 family protein [Terracidiphilus sp.]|jgi:uncharacterized protein (TIGR03435 family)